eukprot:CAMPEP_0179158602 /NCGR_PEP_ID=MMETSP0796-20121207/77394_1 /TAXON_ID=73915 /ORGANISM="Pyrodinium bahamense, Strain pbaha01" /LENGTH=88 /DNA_ID=CAMNT_0020860277 /DNA_START=7 /DNA_END=270 /DNA_ORIENTATION=-
MTSASSACSKALCSMPAAAAASSPSRARRNASTGPRTQSRGHMRLALPTGTLRGVPPQLLCEDPCAQRSHLEGTLDAIAVCASPLPLR